MSLKGNAPVGIIFVTRHPCEKKTYSRLITSILVYSDIGLCTARRNSHAQVMIASRHGVF